MQTFTGTHVTRQFGAPSIRDIAVHSMRIVRFNGAGRVWWPVGMHLLFVAEILNVIVPFGHKLEHHGLLHDAGEAAGVSDICRPMKVDEQRKLEHVLLNRIYQGLGITPMTATEEKIVKQADDIAVISEGCVCGPPGFAEVMGDFARNDLADELLGSYLEDFKPEEAIDPDGRWVKMYERRLRLALGRVQTLPEHLRNKA